MLSVTMLRVLILSAGATDAFLPVMLRHAASRLGSLGSLSGKDEGFGQGNARRPASGCWLRTHLKCVDDTAPKRPVRIMATSAQTIHRVSPIGSAAMRIRSRSSSGVVMNQSADTRREARAALRPAVEVSHMGASLMASQTAETRLSMCRNHVRSMQLGPVWGIYGQVCSERSHRCSGRSIWTGRCSGRS